MIDFNSLSHEIIGYRRHLHQIPELGFYVYKTSAYVRSVLEQLSCQVEPIVQTGLLAFFDFGKEKTLAFRADMDALPIQEETGLPYASTHDGCMHACGHDGHMAAMLGFAKVLDDYKRSGKDMPYNALLLFQPAEETIDGALRICGTHIFDHYHIRAIFGLHLWPGLPSGTIWSAPGPVMAKNSELDLVIEGRSAHITKRHLGVDALWIGAEALRRIYAMEAGEFPQNEMRVLRFGRMVSGTVRNAVSSRTELEGTVRVFSMETFERLARRVREIAADLEREYGCRITVRFSEGYPPVTNDPALLRGVEEHLGRGYVSRLERPELAVDDFSFYQLHVPGVYAFLGLGNTPALHANNFDFDERVLSAGVRYYENLLLLP